MALEADGRTGYLDQLSRAYQKGYWALESSVGNGGYQVYVDLATGELVDADSVSGTTFYIEGGEVYLSAKDEGIERSLASDEEVIVLAFHLNELDAQSTVQGLEEEARKPYASCYDSEEQEVKREGTRRLLELEKVFTRKTIPA